MRPHHNRQRSRAAEHALDELDRQDTGTTRPLPEDPGLASEIASMRALTTLLAEVPAEAWQPISTPAPESPVSSQTRRRRRRLTRSGGLAAATAVACLAIGFAVGGLVNHGPGSPAATRPPQAATATLRPLPGQPAAAVARVQLAAAGRIVISVKRLPRPDAHHFYEAWLMTSATKLVPVASFRPDAHGRALVRTSLPAPVGAFRYIDVSLQRAAAGPTHSGDSVLRGPTAPLAHTHG
jgi:Anti-sigma-K factor rskA, C-terminal